MQLLILRHGDADLGGPDQCRQLSAFGREQVHRQALRHYQEISAVEVVVSSPYVRAVQTTEIVTQAIAVKSIEWLDDLAPHGSLRGARVHRALHTVGSAASVHCTVACSVVVEFEVCLECGARASEASNVKTWPQANTILHPYDASSRTSGDSGAHLRRSDPGRMEKGRLMAGGGPGGGAAFSPPLEDGRRDRKSTP